MNIRVRYIRTSSPPRMVSSSKSNVCRCVLLYLWFQIRDSNILYIVHCTLFIVFAFAISVTVMVGSLKRRNCHVAPSCSFAYTRSALALRPFPPPRFLGRSADERSFPAKCSPLPSASVTWVYAAARKHSGSACYGNCSSNQRHCGQGFTCPTSNGKRGNTHTSRIVLCIGIAVSCKARGQGPKTSPSALYSMKGPTDK